MRGRTRRGLALDAVLGLLLAWSGWMSTRFGGAFEDRPRRPPGPGREGRGGRDFGSDPGSLTPVSPGVVVALVVLGLAVAGRRLAPRTALVVVAAGLGGYFALGGRFGPVLLAPAFVVHTLATTYPLRKWAPWTLLLLPAVGAGFWPAPVLVLVYATVVVSALIAVVPALIALLGKARQEGAAREREEERRRYLDEERLRIAREVHDVVGHSLSVITLQAGVALHVLERSPQKAGESLEAIRTTSRQALAELRTTLAVFRDSDGGAPMGLRPGLGRLDELVNALIQAGRRVEVVRDPPALPELPTAVDQAAFRIIQEALTNVVRHAPGALATVEVRHVPGRLMLQVADDGPATTAPAAGNGLTGMIERARAIGGTLTWTATSPHGLVVFAELPLTGHDSTHSSALSAGTMT